MGGLTGEQMGKRTGELTGPPNDGRDSYANANHLQLGADAPQAPGPIVWLFR